MISVSLETLQRVGQSTGLELVGILPVERLHSTLHDATTRLTTWQASGFAGEMQYMERAAELFASPLRLLPDARSVVTFLVSYRGEQTSVAANAIPQGWGRVARYAWGRDYHRVLKKRLNRFVESVRQDEPSIEARVFADAVPALERTFGAASGLGFIGRNSMLIRPGWGSFTFLCEIVWNVDVSGWERLAAESTAVPGSRCGSCRRCLPACPTDALVADGMLDARRCISYLTIEKKSAFSEEEARMIGNWVFGCDICQEVCPFNHEATKKSSDLEFSPEAGSGAALELVELLKLSSAEIFLDRFAGTAIMRAGRESLLRNACAVLANTGSLAALEPLLAASNCDPSPLVRDEAARSIRRLNATLGTAPAVGQTRAKAT